MLNKENKKSIDYVPPSLYGIEELMSHIFDNFNSIQLVYLPQMNKKTKIIYSDGNYIENNLIKNNFNQELDILYCIIDDNEFFNQVNPIKNIKIKKLYLIFIKGNKSINIYYAIKKYLSIINNEYIEEIIFGEGFFKKEKIYFYNERNYYKDCINYYVKIPILEFLKEEVFINKKKLKINNYNKINLKLNAIIEYNLIYLGMALLFDNANIEGVKIIDSKSYNNKNFESDQSYNILLIKIYDLLLLKNNKFMEKINSDNKKISTILFIGEDAVSNKENENYTFNYYCTFFYSEKPIKNLNINKFNYSIEDDNEGLILGDTYINRNFIPNLMFLLTKFHIIKYKGDLNFIIDCNRIIIYSKDHNECFFNLIKYINKNYFSINYIYCINFMILRDFLFEQFDKNIKKIFMVYNDMDKLNDNKDYIIKNKNIKYLITQCNVNSTQNLLSFLKKNIKKKIINKKMRHKNQINSFIENNLIEEEKYNCEDEEFNSEDDLYIFKNN